MSLKLVPIILGVVVIALLGVLIFVPAPKKTNAPTVEPNATSTASNPDKDGMWSYTSLKGKTVRVSIAPNTKLYDGMRITGNIPAGWPFEAVFGVKVLDDSGREIGGGRPNVPNWTSPTGAWFSVYLTVRTDGAKTGYLMLQNDNPSGLPTNDDYVRIPVGF